MLVHSLFSSFFFFFCFMLQNDIRLPIFLSIPRTFFVCSFIRLYFISWMPIKCSNLIYSNSLTRIFFPSFFFCIFGLDQPSKPTNEHTTSGKKNSKTHNCCKKWYMCTSNGIVCFGIKYVIIIQLADNVAIPRMMNPLIIYLDRLHPFVDTELNRFYRINHLNSREISPPPICLAS